MKYAEKGNMTGNDLVKSVFWKYKSVFLMRSVSLERHICENDTGIKIIGYPVA